MLCFYQVGETGGWLQLWQMCQKLAEDFKPVVETDAEGGSGERKWEWGGKLCPSGVQLFHLSSEFQEGERRGNFDLRGRWPGWSLEGLRRWRDSSSQLWCVSWLKLCNSAYVEAEAPLKDFYCTVMSFSCSDFSCPWQRALMGDAGGKINFSTLLNLFRLTGSLKDHW